MKNKRIPSFQKLWKNSFEEFYQDYERKEKLERIREKRMKMKESKAE